MCVPPTRPTQLSVITFFFPLAHTVASHTELRSSPLHHLWPEERDVHVQCYWIISFVLEFLCAAGPQAPSQARIIALPRVQDGGRARETETNWQGPVAWVPFWTLVTFGGSAWSSRQYNIRLEAAPWKTFHACQPKEGLRVLSKGCDPSQQLNQRQQQEEQHAKPTDTCRGCRGDQVDL